MNEKSINQQLTTITDLLNSTESQLILAGFNLLLSANDAVWTDYLQVYPECNHVIQCLSMGKQKLTSEILEKCWITLTKIYVGSKDMISSTDLLNEIVSKYLKHVFHSLSRSSCESLTHSILDFMLSAVLYDNEHAHLIISHCNLAHNIYHYMFSHKSSIRPRIIKFVLSFFMTDDYQLIRTILENKVVFNNIFKYIKYDSIDLAYFIIAIMAKKIFSPEISKKLKISVFSSTSMLQLIHLLAKTDEISLEDDPVTFQLRQQGIAGKMIPFSDYIETFIKLLCTSDRFGLRYILKLDQMKAYKYNNPAILHILRAIPLQLRVGEKVQSLIIELLHFSPDITYSFLSEGCYLIVPRIEKEWVFCVEFLIRFYSSMPLRASIEKCSYLININVSCLSVLLFPPQTTKLHFNQGILHKNYFCKHLTTQLLTCLLRNFLHLASLTNFDSQIFLETIRSKLPDVMSILSQFKLTAEITDAKFTADLEMFGEEIVIKYSHLCESIADTFRITFLNLLLLYQQLYPLSILQTNYSVTKLLTQFSTNDDTLLIALRIVNQVPAGAIKWLDTKSGDSLFGILISIYLSSDVTALSTEIELCLLKFTREMPHLSVTHSFLKLAVSTIKSMLGMRVFPDICSYVPEMGKFLVEVIEHGASELNSPSDELSFLVQILEEYSQASNDDFAILEKMWTRIDSDIYQDEKIVLIFFLFSKLQFQIGFIQENVILFFSKCFELLLSKKKIISNFPLPCQVIYIHMLEYFETWARPNTDLIRKIKPIKLSVEENILAFQRNSTDAFYNILIRMSDLNKLIEFRNEFPTDFIIDILKFIPYGFAEYMLNKANTDQLNWLPEVTAKLNFYEWLFQSYTLSNFHLDVNTHDSTYQTNFSFQLQPTINLFFQSIGSGLDHQCLLNYSEFCLALLGSTNQLDQSILTRLIKHCTSVIIQFSQHFNTSQNTTTIMSTMKWLGCLHLFTNSDSAYKRQKVQSELSYELIYSILFLITTVECSKPRLVLDLHSHLNHYSKTIENLVGRDSMIILGIQSDILASMEWNVKEPQFVEADTISYSCLPQNNLSAKETDLLESFHKNGVDSLNLVNKDLRLAKEILLKSYTGTLSKEDQNILHIIQTMEETADTTCCLQPFVWSHSVETYLLKERKATTHLLQGYDSNDILASFSAVFLEETISNFPVSRGFTATFSSDKHPIEHMYDNCFLLPVISYILAPGVVVDCRKFAELGCLGFLFRCLSSLCYDVRAAAAHCLERYTTHLSYSSFREKRQISLLLELTANTLSQDISRIPSIHTALLARVIPILLYPQQQLFLLITKFLLSKPMLNLEELPLLKTMILSSSPAQKREKLWMIKLLTEGILCEDDYKFYKRRHVFPLLFSMCDPSLSDLNVCLSILEFALKVTKLPFACKELTSYEGLQAYGIHLRSQVKHIPDSQVKTSIEECLNRIVLLGDYK